MKNGHTYTPKETKEHEDLIRWMYRRQIGTFRFPATDNLSIRITAFYAIPKSTGKAARARMATGEIRPTVKPDWDNVGKLVTDALNGIAYADDKQIVDARVRKFYAKSPITVIEIENNI